MSASQEIVCLLEDQLRPLVQSELSVLVDVLHHPELLFPANTDARRRYDTSLKEKGIIIASAALRILIDQRLCTPQMWLRRLHLKTDSTHRATP